MNLMKLVRLERAWLAAAASMFLMPMIAAALPPPPPELKELYETGRVRFVFYDPAEQAMVRPGRTSFYAGYRWNFQYKLRKRRERTQLRVIVQPRLVRLDAELEHEVMLPQNFDTDAIWQRSLVVHEFDHVAISTDPRPRRLVEHMARKLLVLERRVSSDQVIDDAWIHGLINDEMQKRQEAVRAVIDFNNRRLDALSEHGMRELADRAHFFALLFTRENLQEAEFPYLSEVSELVRRPDYLQLDLARQKALRPEPRSIETEPTKP